MPLLAEKGSNVVFEDQHPSAGDSRVELLDGLCGAQKSINPKYFYDAKGSALFEQITTLPEYYPTSTEIKILQRYADEMADYCGKDCVLIEPGSGNSDKVRLLLDALRPSAYVPLDISSDFLYEAAVKLGREYPWLAIHAICADFADNWQVPETLPEGKRVAFYPGSTIGNFEPQAAKRFLRQLHSWLGSDGGVLIGVDLHKQEAVLNAAYNDEKGVTEAFNLNVLSRVNQLLGGDFNASNFDHRAFYDTELNRIEMHLVSNKNHSVTLANREIEFAKGETIHTENSYKYSVQGFQELAQTQGFRVEQSWLDENAWFSVHYLAVES